MFHTVSAWFPLYLSTAALGAAASLSFHHPTTKVEFWNSGTCPYAQRAWIALVEKGVDFESKLVDLSNKQATPDFEASYRKANPNALSSSKVPVLVVKTNTDETEYYTESKVVVEAIDELWPHPAPLLPKDSVTLRARVRLFGDAVYDSVFGGSRSAYALARRKVEADEQGGETWDPDAERKGLCESLAALDACLREFSNGDSEGPFVLGDHFSMAECCVAPFVQRADAVFSYYGGLNVMEICKVEGYNRAGEWWKAVLERESVVSTGKPAEEYVASAGRLIEMMRSRS